MCKCKCENKDNRIKELEKENKNFKKMVREYKKLIDKQNREINSLKKHPTLTEEELHIIYEDVNLDEINKNYLENK
mgnify:FL=1